MSAPSAPASQLPDYLDILLAPFRSDPTIGAALLGAGSDAGRFFGWLHDGSHPTYARLSGGEQALMDIALALWNGNPEARISDLAKLDGPNRQRACTAILARFSPLWGKE